MIALHELYGAMEELSITPRRRIESFLAGCHRSLLVGARGVEFHHYAEASDDTPARDVDLRRWAAEGELWERRFRRERELPLALVVDLTADMRLGNAQLSKGDLALFVAFLLWRSAIAAQSRVGAVIPQAEMPLIFYPSRRAAMDCLADCWEERRHLASERDMAKGLEACASLLRRPGAAVVISDFWIPPGVWEAELEELAARHEVIAVRIRDAREDDPFVPGQWFSHDPSGGAIVPLDETSVAQKQAYRSAADQHARRLRRVIEERGGRLMECFLPPVDGADRAVYLRRVLRSAADDVIRGLG